MSTDTLGDLLVERGILTLAQFDEAKRLSAEWGVSFMDVLEARPWVTSWELAQELSFHFNLPLEDLRARPARPELLCQYDPVVLSRNMMIPVRWENNRLSVAVCEPGPRAVLEVRKLFGTNADIVIATRNDILRSIQLAFRDHQSEHAVYALANTDPDMSAQRVVTSGQAIVLYALFTVIAVGLALWPFGTLIALNVFMTLFYTGGFLFKAILVWVGGSIDPRNAAAINAEARLLQDTDLPIYTILVPMFQEPEVLPILAQALRSLDYPLAKLDIKIVLEEGDEQTLAAAKALSLEAVFEIIVVPSSHPQTKPKACNYALRFARGEYLVIYDAEDKPEPDQLKKVLAAFRQLPENTACIQCRLNYYNVRENWLTRMFTLDYSLWFDLMLPGLERLNVPIPLGGTSNHFRMDVLQALNAWDPFNVTEDADLGIRLTQKGYRVGVIDSTTYEEANVSIPNWIRQRSRWIKGYMQTLLVHTRRPIHLVRSIGWGGTLGFIFFIGGTCLSGVINPFFWAMFTLWLIFGSEILNGFFPPEVIYLSLFNLIAGNGLLVYLSMIAPFRRRWTDLAPWGASIMAYWMLMTIAAYKALGQLLVNPFYWEKTQHGLSSHTARYVEQARSAVERT